MAKRRRAATAQIVRVPSFQRAPAPVIQIRQTRAAAPRKPKKHHRRRSSSAGSSMNGKTMLGAAIGGAIFGFIEKTFPALPTLPIVGRSGTVAIACYFLQRHSRMGGSIVRDTGLAAAVIAGYELGKDGHISGDVSPQVHGISSQV